MATDPRTGNDLHGDIERERDAALPDARLVSRFRAYYRGRQRGTLTTAQQQLLHGVTGNRFADNVCKKIITEGANRLELLRYEVSNAGVRDFLADLYTKNTLADVSGDVHVATLRDANSGLSLAWDAARTGVTLHRERWWDGMTGLFVAYGDDGTPVYAVRDWTRSGVKLRTLWFPDEIRRFVADGRGWRPRTSDAEPNGVAAWAKGDGSPLGIPVVHFANGSDDDSPYGASELDGGVLGFQDEINDIQRDLTTAARMTAYQMFTATGVETTDAAGNPVPFRVGPGAVFKSKSPDARFGTLAAGDLSQLERAYRVKLQAVSRMTDTPVHLITGGDWPSGEALIRAEQPLVAKVRRAGKTIGPAWATVAHRATEVANTYGAAGLDEAALIVAVFAEAERPDALTRATTAATVSKYVSEHEVLRLLGYAPEAVEGIMRERETEAQARAARAPQPVAPTQESGAGNAP